jgi:hypothetical protein
VRLYELYRKGDPASRAKALELHNALLPIIVFMIRTINQALCYGKRFYARQCDIEILSEKEPFQKPTPFGLSESDRLFNVLKDIEERFEIKLHA